MEAYKYIVDVDSQGKIVVPEIPKIHTSKAEVIILPIKDDDYSDLLNASESTVEFWDNQADEVWDHV